MQLGINTDTKTIELYSKVNIQELLNTLGNLEIDLDEWSIEIKPQIIRIPEPSLPNPIDNPFKPPYRIGDYPPYTQPNTYPWTTGTPYKPLEIWYSCDTNFLHR